VKAAGLTIAAVLLLAASLPVAASSSGAGAVRYRERGEGGPARDGGRTLRTEGRLYAGIDINNTVDIEIDGPRLQAAIVEILPQEDLSPELKSVLEQLTILVRAADRIEPALQETEATFQAYFEAELARRSEGSEALVAAKDQAFQKQAAVMGTEIRALIETLGEAATRRFQEQGVPAAAKKAEEVTDRVLSGPALFFGYDWDALHAAYAAEIHYVEGKLGANAENIGLMIRIVGHRVARNGATVAIHLPGYNEVEIGPVEHYRKVRFEVPPEQAELLAKYEELAQKTEEAASFGEAFVAMLRADFEVRRPEVEALLESARGAADDVVSSAEGLKKWADPTTRAAWVATVRADLEQTDQGKKVLEAWESVETVIQESRDDLAALREYANLSARIRGADAEKAMSRILELLRGFSAVAQGSTSSPGFRALVPETWGARFDRLRAFLEAVEQLAAPLKARLEAEDGPFGDLERLRESIENAVAELETVSSSAREWFLGLFRAPPILEAADFPEPKGQKALKLGTEDPSTSFDLRTIKEGRAPDDEIWLKYEFLRGEEEIGNATWTDKFRIRVFGWQDRYVAGLAFTKQHSTDTWEPTATLSWLLFRRGWPKAEDDLGLRGLGGFDGFSGFGLSTMPLDYDEGQSVEVGIGPAVSFINHRILLGYGWNLQVETNRELVFFSIRIFQSAGPLKEVSPKS